MGDGAGAAGVPDDGGARQLLGAQLVTAAEESRLYGTWMAEGGGHLLELAPNGEYHVAAGTGEQVDYGEWALQGSKLTLTSWPDSVECSSGDRLVLGGVEVGDSGTALLRATVRENTCGAAWTPERWVLIPYEGS